jgi:hypothetical protein
MVRVGPARAAGPYELCLDPGGSAAASIYVHERTLAFRIRARSQDPAREAQLWVRIEGDAAPERIRVREPGAAAHRVRAAPGRRRTFEVSVPPTSPTGACVAEVALTQP